LESLRAMEPSFTRIGDKFTERAGTRNEADTTRSDTERDGWARNLGACGTATGGATNPSLEPGQEIATVTTSRRCMRSVQEGLGTQRDLRQWPGHIIIDDRKPHGAMLSKKPNAFV